MERYTIESPQHGLLEMFVRRDRDQALIDFTIGLHAVTLERSLTKAEIVQMARSRWKELYAIEGYRIVKVDLVTIEEPEPPPSDADSFRHARGIVPQTEGEDSVSIVRKLRDTPCD